MIEFEPWPKIARLFRPVTITEKIDGTNGAIVIQRRTVDPFAPPGEGDTFEVAAQSRNRLITPTDDNYGFAAWVAEHRDYLVKTLGEGRHFGEWWGKGINRGYGLKEKRFSLFNTHRWDSEAFSLPQLSVVPVLYDDIYRDCIVDEVLDHLHYTGSKASLGFNEPEGIVMFHKNAKQLFKVTLRGDSELKGN